MVCQCNEQATFNNVMLSQFILQLRNLPPIVRCWWWLALRLLPALQSVTSVPAPPLLLQLQCLSWHAPYGLGVDPWSGETVYCCLGRCCHCDGIKVTWLVSAGITMAEQGRRYAICERWCECAGLSVDRMEAAVSNTGVTGTAAVPVFGGVEV